ncbi:anaerobic ribonucleoside-triphosphate reductase activating protein [Flavobacterium sp. SM2513]|uniref:anaerobic ribonucleoside-triphosphate reductase activating protein n=1 Tax=Flavobacterium sp. SM2513 TaxID=3424766 RepID=UPI003D7F23DA
MEKKANIDNALTLQNPTSEFLLKKAIHSITPFTLLDYPEKTACILWFSGCNMKCGYCYNPEIVFGKGQLSFSELFSFLQKRTGLIDAVVFSGGECLLHKDIIEVVRRVKQMGFLVKIDTNGSKPLVLEKLLNEQLIDYVAMDFKGTKEKFQHIAKLDSYERFMNCLLQLKKDGILFEIRTTFHSNLLNKDDILEMKEVLENEGYSNPFYVQNFRKYQNTIEPLPDSFPLNEVHFSPNMTEIIFR